MRSKQTSCKAVKAIERNVLFPPWDLVHLKTLTLKLVPSHVNYAIFTIYEKMEEKKREARLHTVVCGENSLNSFSEEKFADSICKKKLLTRKGLLSPASTGIENDVNSACKAEDENLSPKLSADPKWC